ncbi:hypothetical protein I302_101546 [Kwoniella bestiolae CBS 10118]|uniref:Uncharacterized protein n=1 Tax=Kwoniella bestiolae CBS 10118 TaxID=1296100 RepID=A0A1B9GCJ8_9TREE|nr:hypothetical protein I302_00231 [Kwoniella bestiolae CBS 10118]OCF28742.1 hypothetical protein I302_00231 [Kwoniella bestiolae CBS 10118]
MSSSPNQGAADPGPSTSSHQRQHQRPARTTRSHSFPSLTHWIGTPEGGLKRNWIPSTSPGGAIICLEDKKGVGRVDKGKGKDVGVEEGLSQLYVTHEKHEASSSPIPPNQRRRSPFKKNLIIPPTPREVTRDQDPEQTIPINSPTKSILSTVERTKDQNQNQRNSWGSGLFGSVVTAGVFGAALGLTAYRLLANQPSPTLAQFQDGPARGEQGGDGQAGRIGEEQEEADHKGDDEEGPTSKLQEGQQQEGRALGVPTRPTEDARHVNQDRHEPQIAEASTTAALENAIANPTITPYVSPSQGQEEPVEIAQQPISNLPPPPAYEETERTRRGSRIKEWEDIDDHLLTPSSSSVSTLRSKPSMYLSPSPSPSAKAKRRRAPQPRMRRSKSSRNAWLFHHPLSDSRSLPSIEIYHPSLSDDEIRSSGSTDIMSCVNSPVGQFSASHPTSSSDNTQKMELASNSQAENEVVASAIIADGEAADDEEDDKDTNEMISRLDSMSIQLAALIEEGKKALETTPGLGTTPGWEDELESEGGRDLFTPSPSPSPGPVSGHNHKSNGGEISIGDISENRTEKKLRRKSQIPMRVGSDIHLKHSSSSSSKLDLDLGEGSSHRKVGSSGEIEGIHQRSKIPVMSKSRSMVAGLNAI